MEQKLSPAVKEIKSYSPPKLEKEMKKSQKINFKKPAPFKCERGKN